MKSKVKILRVILWPLLKFDAWMMKDYDAQVDYRLAHDFCDCAPSTWEPCGCGNQPPYHCMYCCLNLSEAQCKLSNLPVEFQPKEQIGTLSGEGK